MRRWWVLVPTAAMLLMASPANASAARFASNGASCTIVGTAKADVLRGTNARDVICGRGGDDIIRGRGGNDIVDGGPGNDTVDGGAGNDRVYGGSGHDAQTGGSGDDVVAGGSGGDDLLGGGGADALRGQDGNDDLDGEAGGDRIDGGSGTNWCTVGSDDVQNRCVYDRTAPVIKEILANPAAVDVTTADRRYTLRVHVTDDTGLDWVSLYTDAGESGGAKLVSGDVRDGWWQVEGVVRRYAKPGSWGVVASAGDRINRQSWRAEENAFTVRDANPDTTAPAITSFAMSRSSVDVRTGDATVVVTAEIREDKSGATEPELALLTPPHDYNGAGVQDRLTRVSGTQHSGKYRAEVIIPRGSTGGRWNVSLTTRDRVGNVARYVGPDVYAMKQHETYNNYLPLPSGGRLDVLGKAVDTQAPQMHDLVVNRTVIDTLPGPVNVTFDVSASDVGDGVDQVTVSVIDRSNWVELQGNAYKLPHSGTTNSGIWRVTVTFPQGAAPGTYWVGSIMLWDRTNTGYYRTPVSAEGLNQYVLGAEHYRTSNGAAWDGSITVVENPAG